MLAALGARAVVHLFSTSVRRSDGLRFFHTFHAQRDALATEVDSDDADLDVLVEADDLGGVGDIAVG